MNVLAILFLAALLIEAALSLVAQVAELRSLREPLPDEFRTVFDENAYRRSQEYGYERVRLNMVVFALNLAVILIFWLAGGFGWWDQVVRGAGWSQIPTAFLYVAGLLGARTALSLPISIYSTFVLEKRYGFNRTTAGTFVGDMAKGLVLAVLLGAPLLAGAIWLLSHPGWWPFLVLWAAAVLLSLLLQYIVPVWIMPLFNKFTPLENSEVRDAVLDYTHHIGFPIQSLFVIDGSRRSTKANAFFTGFGRNKRLALYDTLLSGHGTQEMVAVVAHEVGHFRRHHVLWGMLLGFAQTGLGVVLLGLLLRRPELFAAFRVDQISVYAGLVLFSVFIGPFERVASVPLLALSRKHEREADAYAALTYGPDPMISALKRLAADSLTHLTPAPLYVLLNYSHPPVVERVRLLSSSGSTGPAPPR